MTTEPKSLIVQSDGTLLLEVHHPSAQRLRHELAAFAHLEKSPEYFHEYRITPISLWNAAQSGWSRERIVGLLTDNARYPVPKALIDVIDKALESFGRFELVRGEESDDLILRPRDAEDDHLTVLCQRPSLAKILVEPIEGNAYIIDPIQRGALKVAMIRNGFPVADRAGFKSGASVDVKFDEASEFSLRNYQVESVDAFFSSQGGGGGSGVVVLPCGAGKTMVGIGLIEKIKCQTLILAPNITSVRQWRKEIIRWTNLGEDDVAEYSGARKDIAPITVATYQITAHRKSKTDEFTHLDLFSSNDWGLIIYDEVHMLPAPVFRFTAEIQARRRLGLTATLVREDGREDEVFTLIGPRIYDMPWRDLEQEGFIAKVRCVEVRLDLPLDERDSYLSADRRHRFRISSENPMKLKRLHGILKRHEGDRILVIGQYLRQLKDVSRSIGAPLITGHTPQDERERLYAAFRGGEIPVLIVSKVGNFAVDLPDASVAVQISGTYGSRQEEAQRLGRVLRPKSDGREATFYSLVTRDSRDQDFALRRQRFLMEQGYQYEIEEQEEVLQ
ncbi:MAG: DEAD/DEAH box helicase [Planctomycetes bacterium]|nr:DEAD/DEAH box helicase [Planctomycetota bacterium]MBT6453539.1 DEAD/DEAH box helicase [Planctomycetota bacterium]MBT6540733.1 DEAD/DEAH box helicase [Planctomycetota bacterium]MBT6783397.1 DEAD/DEAH box helicase [Planctomycetota bacterium]MBT6968336.1 DEAD/DEAH box helicase [Planctomycetota bacterium]